MFVLRSTQNTKIRCVGRMQNCWMLKLVVHIATTGL